MNVLKNREWLKGGNWGLKLLALILAIIVYHSLKPDIGFTQETNDRHIFQPSSTQE